MQMQMHKRNSAKGALGRTKDILWNFDPYIPKSILVQKLEILDLYLTYAISMTKTFLYTSFCWFFN